MKENDDYALLSFPSTHHAIAGEKVVEACNVEARLVPLPPQISAGCGLVLQVKGKDVENVLSIFSKENLLYEDVFLVAQENGKKVYTKKTKS